MITNTEKNKNYKTNKYYPFSDLDCQTGNPVIRNKSGGNKSDSIKPFQLYLRVYGLAFGLSLNSAMQIILENMLEAITVLCGVVTTIEGTQRSKRFFFTLEYLDFTRPGMTMMFYHGLELLIVTNSKFR